MLTTRAAQISGFGMLPAPSVLFTIWMFLSHLMAVVMVNGVWIFNCDNNKVDLYEDAPLPVICGDSHGTVTWRGNGDLIGECRADGTCTTYLTDNYSLNSSRRSTRSRLAFRPQFRSHAGVTVTCSDSRSTASCTVVVRSQAVLSECDVTTDTASGSVSGSCRVKGGYSSDKDYSCRWTVNNQQSFGGFDSRRDTCSFKQPLPQERGLYTYTIAVLPRPTTWFSHNVTIESSGPAPSLPKPEGNSTAPTLHSKPCPTSSASWTAAIVVIVLLLLALATAVTTTVVLWRKLKDKTYDTVCPPYEEHRYLGLQVTTTGSAIAANR